MYQLLKILERIRDIGGGRILFKILIFMKFRIYTLSNLHFGCIVTINYGISEEYQ